MLAQVLIIESAAVTDAVAPRREHGSRHNDQSIVVRFQEDFRNGFADVVSTSLNAVFAFIGIEFHIAGFLAAGSFATRFFVLFDYLRNPDLLPLLSGDLCQQHNVHLVAVRHVKAQILRFFINVDVHDLAADHLGCQFYSFFIKSLSLSENGLTDFFLC